MAEFKIEVKGLRELQTRFKQLESDLEKALFDSIEDGGGTVKTYSVQHVHVVTGWLRSHIGIMHVTKSEKHVEVEVGVSLSEVPYGEIEEFRPDWDPRGPHSYLRTSLDKNEKEIRGNAEKKIKEVLRRYS